MTAFEREAQLHTKVGGFRLSHFEVFNWGTFDSKVWQLSPRQENALLTGNIGSGKSTLVDGLTTLLVPTRKLSFNKAAGAEDKERSLESYFKGFYTSQQDEQGKARSVGLRKDKHYSVLLARFDSQSLEECVTIAQVFWIKPGEMKVKRLFVVATGGLTIAEDFCHFGNQINQLRKRLRKAGVQLFDSFGPYAQTFSKLLGLGSDGKALELFNQTISMKSVGSVTDFVRQNMLEKPDVELQLQELERNYDDLKRLHDAVIAARHKVALLEPVSHYGQQAIEAAQQRAQMNQARDLTEHYMAGVAIELYQTRLNRREQELQRLDIQLKALEREKMALGIKIDQLKEDIRNNGGERLGQLEREIKEQSGFRDDSRRLFNNYDKLVGALSLSNELDANTFLNNINQAKDVVEQTLAALDGIEERVLEKNLESRQLQNQGSDLKAQISALEKRKSNISIRQLNIRELICSELNVDEQRLPFVGELIQVKSSETLFQGAIERVLHSFALSMLVPEDLYAEVSDMVEQTQLRSKLVYYRVNQPQEHYPKGAEPNSLLNKIDIKVDSEYYDWLQKELQNRFDYTCCEKLSDFRRCDKAITPNGQIKSGRFRHEKDDRHNIADKSRYVLGWSNKEKIRLLGKQLFALQQQIGELDKVIGQFKIEKSNLEKQRQNAQQLAEFNETFDFAQINWPFYSSKIETLQQELRVLQASSDVLQKLQQQLLQLQSELLPLENKCKEQYTEQGKKQNQIDEDQKVLQEKQTLFAQVNEAQRTQSFALLEKYYHKYVEKPHIRIDELAGLATVFRKKLNDRIQHLEEKRRAKESKMVAAMGDFATAFPNDVAELDRSLAALSEYQQILTNLVEEDLPRHESRFKEMLNRDTIRAMALFRSQLDKQQEDIDARIHLINGALDTLDYQPGTFIEIDAIHSQDVDIRDFKNRLKQCVEFTASENDLYCEEKFVQVKDLIEQMRNERKWTDKVVDVRNWQLFNVIERYREDRAEKECYSDSGGKSGGQKEKLAYSILAAAILLQYGLVAQNGNSSKRRFNLVVIDEAFGRGSKDSTRFGLELFKQLGLQLILVTPLQKLDVIEHYVKHVHYVDLQDNRSVLLNMTISEYRERRKQHSDLQQYRAMTQEDV